MATVTGGGTTTVINVGSNDAKAATTNLASAISAALQSGTLTRVPDPNTPPATGYGVLTISTPNTTTRNLGDVSVDLINAGGNAIRTASQVVIASGLPTQQVLGDNENITYLTNGGGG